MFCRVAITAALVGLALGCGKKPSKPTDSSDEPEAKPSSSRNKEKPNDKVAKAGGKPVSEQDMKDVGIFIDNRSGASGQMPSPGDVLDALLMAKSLAAELVRDGHIVLTGAKTREGIWAYEKNAPLAGGWVVGPNGTERLSATEVNSRLSGR